MEKQRIAILDMLNRPYFAYRIVQRLNNLAAPGYSYESFTPMFSKVNTAISGLRTGNYVSEGLVRLKARDLPSLFRCWLIKTKSRKREETEEELNTLITLENAHGFTLVETVPLTAFAEEKPGPGTVGLLALFERKGGSRTPVTLDKWSLKVERPATQELPCPVLGCRQTFPPMSKHGLNLNSPKEKLEAYLCPEHRIYVSPSTFEYEDPKQSILWHLPQDLHELEGIKQAKGGKRTWSRMGRENDEDSFTWNVFYFLHKNKLIRNFLETFNLEPYPSFQRIHEKSIFWSVDIDDKCVYKELLNARADIGENPSRGSEPDIIFTTSNTLIFIELKLNSPAVTHKKEIPEYYYNAAQQFNPFNDTLDNVTDQIGYELMRFILLGKVMAKRLKKVFYLLTITKEDMDSALEEKVRNVINPNFEFRHITWPQIDKFLSELRLESSANMISFENQYLRRYLLGKTTGHDGNGKLRTILD